MAGGEEGYTGIAVIFKKGTGDLQKNASQELEANVAAIIRILRSLPNANS